MNDIIAMDETLKVRAIFAWAKVNRARAYVQARLVAELEA